MAKAVNKVCSFKQHLSVSPSLIEIKSMIQASANTPTRYLSAQFTTLTDKVYSRLTLLGEVISPTQMVNGF